MKIKSNYIGTYYLSHKNMVQQVFMTWSKLKWSKEYTPFGPTDNYLDQSPSDWSKEYPYPTTCERHELRADSLRYTCQQTNKQQYKL